MRYSTTTKANTDEHTKRYLSVNQLAERYGVSVSTIWRWNSEQKIPKPYRVVSSTRWLLSEIEDSESRFERA